MSERFRPIAPTEVDAAYALYMEVFRWLSAKGVRHWLRALPIEEFQGRQSRGELFGRFSGDRLAAIVTISFEDDPDWRDRLSSERRWWLKTLTVDRRDAGQNLGGTVLAESEAYLAKLGEREVYLECVDTDFLPDYYNQRGYSVLQRATITYPSGNTFPVCLMKKPLR